MLPVQEIVGGKYEILHKIHEGGMGAVYKARHRLLDEIRVIKLLRPQLALNEDLQGRLYKEARNAARLRHPHVAQLFDFSVSSDESIAFIVMEYIDGVSLREALRASQPPSVPFALEVARQCLLALGYLHTKGFVHRDVAADNFMLTRDHDGEPFVKLIDLGIAKHTEQTDGTAVGVFVGKARYTSPEQIEGGRAGSPIDQRSDLYSFGVLMYRLLTGRHPIAGETFAKLVVGHLHSDPVPFESSDPDERVPEEIRQVVLRVLQKNPRDRLESTAAVWDALEPLHRRQSHKAELDEILAAVRDSDDSGSDLEPGSTQERLDVHFGTETTPAEVGADIYPTVVREPPQQAAVLAAARRDLELGDLDSAELKLREGQSLPIHDEIDVLLTEIESEQARLREKRRREQRANERIDEIDARILAEDPGAARSLFERTCEEDGGAEAIVAHRDRLLGEIEALERRAAELDQQLENASKLHDSGQPNLAIPLLDDVLAARPGDSRAQALLEEVTAARRHQEELARRAEALASACVRIERQLDAGDLDSAREELDRWIVDEDEHSQIRDLGERHRALDLERWEGAVTELRERTRALLDEGEFEGALSALRVAAESAPAGAGDELQELIEQATREQAEHETAELVARRVGMLEELLVYGKTLRARWELMQARRAHPHVEEFERLSRRLTEQRRAAWSSRRKSVSSALTLAPLREHLASDRSREARQRFRHGVATSAGALGSRAVAAWQWVSEYRPAPDAVRWIVATLTTVVLIVMGWAVLRWKESTSVAVPTTVVPSAEPTEAPAPEVLRSGVILDALPWASVVDIVAADGSAPSDTTAMHTPIFVALEPGSYVVRLQHPSEPEPALVEIEVLEGDVRRVVVDFAAAVTVEEYLDAYGLGR